MAKAYVSVHPAAIHQPPASSAVLAPAVFSVVLDFTSAQATGAVLPDGLSSGRNMIASISADADCFIAIGSAPDCALETATAVSSARMFLIGGASMDVFLPVGTKVAAKAVS